MKSGFSRFFFTFGRPMTDPVFQEAYDNVRRFHSKEGWSALTPRQITEAIYQEIRRIDALRARQAKAPPPDAASK